MEFIEGFCWSMPMIFSEQLARCRFEDGDMLHEIRSAYQETWASFAEMGVSSIQVNSARAPSESIGPVFESNWKLPIKLTLFRHGTEKASTDIEATQGRLYVALWKGDVSVLTATRDPEVPLTLRVIQKHFRSIEEMAMTKWASSELRFAMLRDRVSGLSLTKHYSVTAALGSVLKSVQVVSVRDFGVSLDRDACPTIDVCIYNTNLANRNELTALLKAALYGGKFEGDTGTFKLNAHGVML